MRHKRVYYRRIIHWVGQNVKAKAIFQTMCGFIQFTT